MLKEAIYSSLFILASKINRVRVGYELFRTVRGCCSENRVTALLNFRLMAPILPNSTNPIYLRATAGMHGEITFSSAWGSQTKSHFAVRACGDVNLELVAWRQPGVRAACPSAQENPRGSNAL